MRASRGVGWVLLFGAFFCVESAAAEPPDRGAAASDGQASTRVDKAAREAAGRLFDQGRAAALKGDWQGSYTAQRAAYEKYPHPEIAGALGDSAFALGKYPEAIGLLSRNLRESASLPADERAAKEKRIADAKARCGTLFIDAPDGALVKVDGAPVGKHPLGEMLYLLPGSHEVELVSAAGASKQKVEIRAGEGTRVEARAAAGADSGARPAPSTGSPSRGPVAAKPPGGERPPSEARSPLPVVLLGAAAGLGVVAGAVLLGVSASKEDEAAGKLAELGSVNRPCFSARCLEIDGLLAEGDALGSAALGVWIGAGIVGGAAATVAILRRAKKPASAATMVPVVSAAGAGVVVSGSF